MVSESAQKVAGTYIPPRQEHYGNVRTWALEECLRGRFAQSIQEFCRAQEEPLEPERVEITSLTQEAIHCRIPCCLSDHESNRTFLHEVRFELNPVSGSCCRRKEVS